MFKKSFSALAIFALTGSVLAQGDVVGTAADVQGLVTVSEGATVGSVTAGSAVIDGSRYVTGSSGSVTLKLAQNCSIVLKPNQSVTVLKSKTCEALWASVQNLGTQNVAAAGLSGGNGVALGLGGALGIAALAGGSSGGGSSTGGSGGNPEVILPPISGQ